MSFYGICDLIFYEDDFTLSIIKKTVPMILSAIKKYAENAMSWDKHNCMQGNP